MSRIIKLYSIPLLVALAVVSCRPRGVLSSSELRSVLHDLHRADAILVVDDVAYRNDDEVGKYYQVVLEKHGITQAQFDSTMVWYTDHPQLFDKIYPKVVAQLEAELEEWKELNDNTSFEKVSARYLMSIDSVKLIYHHGLPNTWHKLNQNEEKSEKSDEKFAYVIIF